MDNVTKKWIVDSLYEKHVSEWSKQKKKVKEEDKRQKKDGKWTEAINNLI